MTATLTVTADQFQSAPRARARGDSSEDSVANDSPRGFNPRPARGRGATQDSSVQSVKRKGFNPRPARGRGATTDDGACGHRDSVSIRAPRAGAGRLVPWSAQWKGVGFQSAPRARARGDAASRTLRRGKQVSIRAPRAGAGRPWRTRCRMIAQQVSIRAPRAGAGRQRQGHLTTVPCMFQSAPRARARGDSAGGRRCLDCVVFQSAPRARARGDHCRNYFEQESVRFQSAPRARARGDIGRPNVEARQTGFNPRPARGRGATRQTSTCPPGTPVSIRAPRAGAGRPRLNVLLAALLRFQSAPRARARGDFAPGQTDDDGCVSIRAPRAGAGRLVSTW